MEDVTPEKIVRLGFDVRELIGGPGGALWTSERRSRFLLRPQIQYPLSVDRAVWPQAVGNLDEDSPLNLWGSVADLLEVAPDILAGKADSPIAIEIAVFADELTSQWWRSVIAGALHPEEDKAIQLTFQEYGYDVADRDRLSGLSNCMLAPAELEGVRNRWAESINSYGLFVKLSDATAYTRVCDSLVPEHAPFFAYRICRVAVRTARPQLRRHA